MTILFNGQPFDPRQFGDTLMAAAIQAATEGLRARIGSIRDPDTGEFPTIVVKGRSIDDLRLSVEGSEALLARVKDVLGDSMVNDEPGASAARPASDDSHRPKVFLSWASSDKELAKRLAETLRANGIDAWFSDWEIGPGDSLRQRIEAGLGDATHFIVLLTPASISRPWVNAEIDAAFVRMVTEGCKFIPLRHGVAPNELTPFLRSLNSPELKDFDSDVRQLVNDLYGVTRKPPLGKPPAVVEQRENDRYSAAALAVARYFVERSTEGLPHEPQIEVTELARAVSLSEDDAKDAVYELRDMLTLHEYVGAEPIVTPTAELFAEFDDRWCNWDPASDAVRVAAELHNDSAFPRLLSEIAARLDWPARRLNPAVTYLKQRDAVRVMEAVGSSPFVACAVDPTDATRRFVKSRSLCR